jgi:hypothetical protein
MRTERTLWLFTARMSEHDDDMQAYRRDHRRIFGHNPIVDLSGVHLCIHPMHRAIQRTIEQPGVEISLPFDFHNVRREEFLTDDEYEIRPEFRS